MSEDDRLIVICVPVTDLLEPYPGSVVRRCEECNTKVWLDGRYAADVKKVKAQILCVHDGLKVMEKEEADIAGGLDQLKKVRYKK